MSIANEPSGVEQADRPKPRITTYFVNGEREETTERELDVKVILIDSGHEPYTEWKLARDRGDHSFENYDEKVEIIEGEQFTATFEGPTPTS